MKHETIETNAGWLIALTFIVISIGGLVEVIPLYFIKSTVEEVKVDGIELTTLSEQVRDRFRADRIGFVYA